MHLAFIWPRSALAPPAQPQNQPKAPQPKQLSVPKQAQQAAVLHQAQPAQSQPQPDARTSRTPPSAERLELMQTVFDRCDVGGLILVGRDRKMWWIVMEADRETVRQPTKE